MLLRNEPLNNWFFLSFSYIGNVPYHNSVFDNADNVIPGTDVRFVFNKRDPFAKLEGEDEDKLLVAMYAWDGNSFPGKNFFSRRHVI